MCTRLHLHLYACSKNFKRGNNIVFHNRNMKYALTVAAEENRVNKFVPSLSCQPAIHVKTHVVVFFDEGCFAYLHQQ